MALDNLHLEVLNPIPNSLLDDKSRKQKLTVLGKCYQCKGCWTIPKLIPTMSHQSNPILLVQIVDFLMHLYLVWVKL